MSDKAVIRTSSEILGGAPVFAGTRVPVQTLFGYLEAGDRLDEFLNDFPTVTRQQAQDVLALSKQALIGRAAESE